MPGPSIPLPEPVTGEKEGTWAHSTITIRLPEIAGRVLDENELLPDQASRIRQLIEEIPSAPIRRLRDHGAPDHDHWQAYCQPYLGLGWLEIPWFFAETYFYRRILEAVDYFSAGGQSALDPFSLQKNRGMDRMEDFLDRYHRPAWNAVEAFDLALWGNQSDLSLWPAGESEAASRHQVGDRSEFLLRDDLESVLDYLNSLGRSGPRFTMILDNVGIELAADLVLARYLLDRWEDATVGLHAKAHPTFVSDATRVDVLLTIERLTHSGTASQASFGSDLEEALSMSRLEVHDPAFWTSPLPLWQIPPDISQQFRSQDLIIVKGDANFRRALGDLQWPFNTPFREVMAYMPAPLLALRSLKSEVACGLDPGQVERAARQDRDWMTNGRWAVRQFYRPRASSYRSSDPLA